MIIKEETTPVEHVLIDNFFSDNELEEIMEEIDSLQEHLTEFEDWDLKTNVKNKQLHGLQLNEKYSCNCRETTSKALNQSSILRYLVKNWAANDEIKEKLKNLKSVFFSYYSDTNADLVKLYGFREDDFYNVYNLEKDTSNIFTLYIFITKEPKEFSGGDLEFNVNGEIKKIPFKNNTAVFIPSRMPHKITKVKMNKPDFLNTCFVISSSSFTIDEEHLLLGAKYV